MPKIPDWVDNILHERFWGNFVHDWLEAIAVGLAVLVAIRLFKGFIISRLKKLAEKTRTRADDIIIGTLDDTTWLFYVTLAVLLGSRFLKLSKDAEQNLELFAILVTTVQIGIWLQSAIRGSIERWAVKRRGPSSGTMAAAVAFISRVVIWSVVFLLVLSNLGVEISALIAGLGVGGVAAALAVQSLLGDMFASLSIYFDRPFDIGDFIIVDDFKGTVERIGMRSTRLASLGGEQIVFANGDLVRARIRNYRRMNERRIAFHIGIEYNLAYDLVERVPDLMREAIEDVESVRFDRAHFYSYGDFALIFEVVYYVLSPDYAVYMEKQHAINLGIYSRFQQEGVPFAFPSRTIYLRSEPADAEEGRQVRLAVGSTA